MTPHSQQKRTFPVGKGEPHSWQNRATLLLVVAVVVLADPVPSVDTEAGVRLSEGNKSIQYTITSLVS